MSIFSHNFSGLFLKKRKPKQEPQPLIIEDSLGRFTLDRNTFSGNVTLLGREITVFLETDGDGQTTADAALEHLHSFAANVTDWDAKIKIFAADEFAGKDGTIETWGGCNDDSEGETISKEEFMRRISLNFVEFNRDGSIFLDYDLDDMFTDHGLAVNADISGKIESCTLWG